MTSIAPGNASLAPRASQRPLTARASLPVVAASKKGFGEAGGKGAKQGAKVGSCMLALKSVHGILAARPRVSYQS